MFHPKTGTIQTKHNSQINVQGFLLHCVNTAVLVSKDKHCIPSVSIILNLNITLNLGARGSVVG
jgi:hypothetical protein